MSTLVIVPARGGSKRLCDKNLALVAGVSLVARAVWAGRQAANVLGRDTMVVVDTDSHDIAAEGRAWGASVPFLRPPEFAGDDITTVESVLHLLVRLGEQGASATTLILLQPTSPLRTVDDVLACWERFDHTTCPSVASVTSNGGRAELEFGRDASGVLTTFPGHEATRCRLTGSVYISSTAVLRERRAFVIPGRTVGVTLPTWRSVDIDTAEDLAVARQLVPVSKEHGFEVADRWIGDVAPCFVIAEAGVNHNGDVGLAKELIDAAADAGADAVKFQTYSPDRLVARTAPKAPYQVEGSGLGSQESMLAGLVLPSSAYSGLIEHANKRGILFLSTPFDIESVDLLLSLGMAAVKIGSGDLTHHPLLRHVASQGRPIVLSTGMATLAEVGQAVQVILNTRRVPLAVLHCVTNYPATSGESNLRAMDTMGSLLGVPVGWSDHTLGIDVALAAVARGASILEKHLTLDATLPGPDHRASLEPGDFLRLVTGVRHVEAALGDGVKQPVASERENIPAARRSLHLTRSLSAGHQLELDDLAALRPGTGIPPSALEDLLGRRLTRALPSGALVREQDLDRG